MLKDLSNTYQKDPDLVKIQPQWYSQGESPLGHMPRQLEAVPHQYKCACQLLALAVLYVVDQESGSKNPQKSVNIVLTAICI